MVTSQDKSNNATGGTDHADQITADTSKCDLWASLHISAQKTGLYNETVGMKLKLTAWYRNIIMKIKINSIVTRET